MMGKWTTHKSASPDDLKERLLRYYGLGEHNNPRNTSCRDRFVLVSIQRDYSVSEIREVVKELRKEYDFEE